MAYPVISQSDRILMKPEMLKILMVIKKFNRDHPGGGTERSGYRLARALSGKGAAIEIAGARMRRQWKGRELAGDREKPIPVQRLFHPRIRFLGTLIYNILLFIKLIAGRHKYTCAHIHFASFEMMTGVIARYLGGPPVICKIACSGESGELSKAKKRYFSPLFFFLLRRVDAAVALSDRIRNELLDAGLKNQKIHIIPNGIDTSVYRPPEPETRIEKREILGLDGYDDVLVFTGRLTRQKGLDVLLRSLGRIENRNYILVIAGQGEMQPHLRALAEELGITGKIRFCGPVKDVLSLYQAGDIFVLPSRDEGLSNSLLEAMSAGMRVVATGISGSSEVIEDGKSGILIPPGDEQALAAALREAFSKDSSMGRRARERIISDYSIGRIAGEYISLYSGVMKNSQ